MKNKNKETVLSNGQELALSKLIEVASLATSGHLSKIDTSLKIRTHSLLVGPSGTGKSHLAREIGSRLGVPVLVVNVSSWMLFGSKTENPTWNTIIQFVNENMNGVILIDEIDKICRQESSWNEMLKIEIHDLLDAVVPIAADLGSLNLDRDGEEVW